MSHEDTVFAQLVDSNPIPHIEDLDLIDVGGAHYLATLEQRSSGVTQLDTRPPHSNEENSRKLAPWIVAAAALLVLGTAIVLVTQDSEQAVPATSPAPTTIADETSTSLLEETPLAADAWEAIPPFTGAGSPTATVRSLSFQVPFSFQGGTGWTRVGTEDDEFIIQMNAPSSFGVLVRPGTVSDVVGEVVEAHQNFPSAQMTEPVETQVGGASGVLIETIGLPTAGFDRELAAWASDVADDFAARTILVGGGQGLIHIVDVNGTTVMVIYSGINPGTYEERLSEAHQIIDSIAWKALS